MHSRVLAHCDFQPDVQVTDVQRPSSGDALLFRSYEQIGDGPARSRICRNLHTSTGRNSHKTEFLSTAFQDFGKAIAHGGQAQRVYTEEPLAMRPARANRNRLGSHLGRENRSTVCPKAA
jgi:hypothetical protein